MYIYIDTSCITSSSSEPVSSLSDLGATSYLQTRREQSLRTEISLSKKTALLGVLGVKADIRRSPGVHLQPGIQLSSFRSIHSAQDLPAVHVNHLYRQVTHLTRLVQRLRGKEDMWMLSNMMCKLNFMLNQREKKITQYTVHYST